MLERPSTAIDDDDEINFITDLLYPELLIQRSIKIVLQIIVLPMRYIDIDYFSSLLIQCGTEIVRPSLACSILKVNI